MKRINQNNSTTVVTLENRPEGVSKRVVHKEDSLGGQKVTCFVSDRPALHSCRQLTITDHYSTKKKTKKYIVFLIQLIESKQPATFRLTFWHAILSLQIADRNEISNAQQRQKGARWPT